MSLEWNSYTIGESCELITGFPFKSKYYLDEGLFKVVRGDNVKEGFIKWDDKKRCWNELNDKLKKVILKEEDIVIGMDGSKLGKNRAIISKKDLPALLAQRVACVRAKEGFDQNYIKYVILSNYFKSYVDKVKTGTSIPHISLGQISEFTFEAPDYKKQKTISSILSTIDKKITVNQEINKNLEDTILKIFDSWFVKFELSNEFSDSKLGLIPKGWKIDYLGSKKSCSIIRSGIDEFDNSKIYVATADVDNSIITSNDTLITMNDKPSRANMQPIAKSIWFAKMIDSRKLIMIDDYCSDLLNNYIFSTGFCGLKCVDKYFYYLWAFLLTDAFDVMKNNFCTGTTMQAINNKDTKLIEFVLPDDNIINQFNVIAKPMFKKIYYNSLEIKKLQRLIDTLLPKLMSGEIDVSKINCDLKIIIRKIYIKSSKLFLWRYLSENQNHIKNTKSNETLLKSRTIHKINKFLAKFNARYRYYRQ